MPVLNRPNVKAFGRIWGIRHTCVGAMLHPSSPSDELRRQCQWLEVRPVPCPVMMASGPYSSLMRRHSDAMVSMASSQVMRSHLPEPRSPTRFMGYRMRFSTSSWISRCDIPVAQIAPRDFGLSGSPSIFRILSPSAVTMTPHRAWHDTQALRIFFTLITPPFFPRCAFPPRRLVLQRAVRPMLPL